MKHDLRVLLRHAENKISRLHHRGHLCKTDLVADGQTMPASSAYRTLNNVLLFHGPFPTVASPPTVV